MFASFYPVHQQTPSSYQRYQDAVAKAEAARVAYLRELSTYGQEPAYYQAHQHPSRRCSPYAYDYDSLYAEEQRRKQYFEQRAQRVRQEREEHRRQEHLQSLLRYVTQSATSVTNEYPILQRQTHVRRRQPFSPVHTQSLAVRSEDWEQLLGLILRDVSNTQLVSERVHWLSSNNVRPNVPTRAPTLPAVDSQPRVSAPTKGLEQFLNHILAVSEANKPDVAPKAPEPSSTSLKEAPTSESLLRTALESRLEGEHDAEIRDTIQTIFESLRLSTPTSAPVNPPSTGKQPAEEKGKEKAVPVQDIVPEEPTPLDVAQSMETITNIEAALQALVNDFDLESLKGLTFTPPPSDIPSYDDDSDASTDSTSRLAYTSHNTPVRYYIHSLNGLLSQLDAVDSFGSEDVRKARKEAVGRVEAALEQVEREVDARFRSSELKRRSTEAIQVPIEETTSEELAAPSTEAVTQSLEVPNVEKASAEAPVQIAETLTSTEQATDSFDSTASLPSDASEPEQGLLPMSEERSAPITEVVTQANEAPNAEVTLEEAPVKIPITEQMLDTATSSPSNVLESEQGTPSHVAITDSPSTLESTPEPEVELKLEESPLPLENAEDFTTPPLEPEPIVAQDTSEVSTLPSTASVALSEPHSSPDIDENSHKTTPLPSESEIILPGGALGSTQGDDEDSLSIPESLSEYSSPTDALDKDNDLSATIRPNSIQEHESFLATAFPDPPAPTKPKASEEDDLVLVDNDAHSDWSEVEA